MDQMHISLIAMVCTFAVIHCVSLSEFYPFGTGVGDSQVPSGDDGNSGIITLGYTIPCFESMYGSLYVNINGIVSFESGFGTYVPTSFPVSVPVIAIFWADGTTTNGGAVYYRSTTSSQLLSKASHSVGLLLGYQHVFQARRLFLATWYGIHSFGSSQSSNLLNTFQLALVSDNNAVYAIYLYNRLQWTTGTSSRGVEAKAGFSNKDGTHTVTLPGSGSGNIIRLIYTSNVGVPGMWIFSLTTAAVTDKCSTNTHNCDTNAACANSQGTFTCSCKSGYNGNGRIGNCADIDECGTRTHNCDVNATCANAPGTFYCTCNYGYTGNGTTGNCAEMYPHMTRRPSLKQQVILGHRMDLLCETITSSGRQDARFIITWFTVDKAGRGTSFYSNIVQANTSNLQISSRLGSRCLPPSNGCYSGKPSFKFRCSVKSYFNNSMLRSPPKISNDYFIGMKVSPTVIHLHNPNDRAQFTITRTMPVIYMDPKCKPLAVTVIASAELAATTSCSIQFAESFAFNETQTFELRQRVSATPQRTDYHVNFRVHSMDCHADWQYFTSQQQNTPLLPGVKISFIASQEQHRQGQCRVTSDPNINTFDGSWFSIRNVGYYILAQNKDREFEVHVRFKECGRPGSLSCTCGFAVWEKTEFVIIDYCKTDRSKPTQAPILDTQIYSASKYKSGTKVIKTKGKSNSITAIMPSGAQVEAYLLSAGNPNAQQFWSLDVFVRVFEEQKGKLDGICGNFDGNPSNDKTSSEIYRLPKEKSIFRSYKKSAMNVACRNETLYCKCTIIPTEDSQYLSGDCDNNVAMKIAGQSLPGSFQRTCLNDNGTDDADGDDGDSKVDWYTPDDSNVEDNGTRNTTVLEWPTPSGIDETRARQICENRIRQTNLWDACSMLKGVNFSRNIETCIGDIKNLDDPTAAVRTAISEVQQACNFAVDTNVSLWRRNATNGTQELIHPDAILGKMCPNQCSFRGNCTDGTCNCLPSFTGFDCLSEVGKIPTLSGLAGSLLCNIRNQSCKAVTVIGTDFADTSNLTCLITKYSVQNMNVYHAIRSPDIVMVSNQQVICSIPIRNQNQHSADVKGSSSTPIHISVSNNAKDFSNRLRYHVYDSLCQRCTSFGHCVQLNGTCDINGYCFADGAVNPVNWCLVCNVSDYTDKWSQRKDNTRPEVKLNISDDALLSKGNNITILVQTYDPETRPMNTSYKIGSSRFIGFVGSQLIIDPTFVPKRLIVKVVDQCGLIAIATAIIGVCPEMVGSPLLKLQVAPDRGIELLCQIATSSRRLDARFNVTWFTVDENGRGTSFYSNILRANTSSLQISSRLGSRCLNASNGCYSGKHSFKFRCSIKSYFVNSTSRSPSKISNDYFIGIKVSPTVIRLQMPNGIARFTITRTMPVIYLNPNCRPLAITVITSAELAATKSCSIQFAESPTFDETQTFELRRRVSATPLKTDYYINFKVHIMDCHADWDYLASELRNTSLLPEVKVSFIASHEQGQCRVTSDPYIYPFDGSYYSIANVGYYILAQNKDREFEVHIRFKECGRALSCTCGFAVWEKTEFVIIDYCKTDKNNPMQPPRLETQVYSASKYKSGTKVIKTKGKSNSITAIMPSGAQVEAYLLSAGNPNVQQFWSLDVFVRVFEEQKGKFDGICGNFDGNPSNDRTSPELYRIPKDRSIFRSYRTIAMNVACRNETVYCRCTRILSGGSQYQPGICDNNIAMDISGQSLPGSFQRICFGDNRTGDSISDNKGDKKVDWYKPEDSNVADNGTRNITVLEWPTPSGINEASARRICESRIRQTTLWDACSMMKGVNFSRNIDTCVGDIKNLDDPDAAVRTAIEEVQQTCNFAVDTNISLWRRNTTNGTHELVRPDKILGKMCPNQCSFHGNCTNGTCNCLPRYTGSDCLSEVGKIPTLSALSGSILCNIRKDSCNSVTIMGTYFADTSNLTCLIRNGSGQNMKTLPAKIVMVSNQQVICSIPFRKPNQYSEDVKGCSSISMLISISNNGKNFSNHLRYHVYDSLCQSCTSFGNCVQMNGTCDINGYCFADGATNPVNWCLICNSTIYINQWSQRNDKRPEIKLNISEEVVISDGDNITILVQTSHPHFTANLNTSYRIGSPRFKTFVGNLLTIGPIFVPKQLTVKVIDQCGTTAIATTNIGDYPQMAGNPVLKHQVTRGRGTELLCDIGDISGRQDAMFNVTWLTVDETGRGKSFYSETLQGNISSQRIGSRLGSRCLPASNGCYSGKESFKFRCSVRSYYINSTSGSPSKISNDYFVGIKVSPTVIYLHNQNDTTRLIITRLLPVIYLDPKCKPLTITIIASPELAATSSCSIQFVESLAVNETQIFELRQRVSATPQRTEYVINFRVIAMDCHADWKYLTSEPQNIPLLPEVKVSFIASNGQHRQGQCRVTSDPNINTFDGSWFSISNAGYYILAQNTDREFAVHVRFKECGGSLSCTCGFAVWEKTEFVIVDYCKTNKNNPIQAPMLETQIYSASKYKSGTKVIKTKGKSNSITAIMPSGAQVEAYLLSAGNPNVQQFWSLDVFVRVFEEQKGKLDGICGNFDGNPSNDRTSPEIYRLSKDRSIFRSYKTSATNVACRNETRYCKCTRIPREGSPYQSGECDNNAAMNIPGQSLPGSFQRICSSDKRAGDSNGDDRDNQIDWYKPDDSDVTDSGIRNITALEWPTPSGIDEARAERICRSRIQQTTLWDACSLMKGVNFSRTIDTCVGDIKNFDDPDAAVRTAIEEVQQTCNFAVNTNVSLWRRHSTNGTQELIRPDAILGMMCPNQCSFRGNCTTGICKCLPKFTGFDCLSEVGKIPTLGGLAGSTLCNIRYQRCDTITVLGKDFSDTSKLVCLIRKVQDLGALQAIGSTQILLVSNQQVICNIPVRNPNHYSRDIEGNSSSLMRISVSNNGQNFSNHLQYQVYDSLCQNCTSFGNCVQVNGTCSINGYCFVDGTANPLNWCLVCNSTNYTDKWMQRKDNKRPEVKLNISNTVVIPIGGNITILVQASDPESRPIITSYRIRLSRFKKLIGNILTIGPVHDGEKLTVKVTDQCGLTSFTTALITTTSPFLTSIFCLDERFGMSIKKNISSFLSVTLKDSSCRATSNSTHITVSTTFSECDSSKMETSDYIIVSNEVILMEAGTGIITRAKEIVIPFSCHYSRSRWTAMHSFRPKFESVIQAHESGYGNFTINFSMARNAFFNAYYPSFPVTVEVNDRVYFEVAMQANATHAGLVIEECYATPSLNRNHATKYTLIENRCQMDGTLQFHNGNIHQKKFSFLAFKFAENVPVIYLHCEVFLCQRSSQDSRCRSGCGANRMPLKRKKRDIERREVITGTSKNYVLDNGPIRKTTKVNSDAASTQVSTTTFVIVLAFGILGIILASLVIVKQIKLRKTRASHQATTTKQIQGLDNTGVEMESETKL